MAKKITLPKSPQFQVWVDTDNAKCVKEWLVALGCSEKKLRAAVKAVGKNGLHVRKWCETHVVSD
jgi:hypothetical protein